MLTLVVLFYEAGAYDEPVTINVYEGVGTSGTLLMSQSYRRRARLANRERCAPRRHVERRRHLHKTMQLQGLPCD
jgi:hypothetical protein